MKKETEPIGESFEDKIYTKTAYIKALSRAMSVLLEEPDELILAGKADLMYLLQLSEEVSCSIDELVKENSK